MTIGAGGARGADAQRQERRGGGRKRRQPDLGQAERRAVGRDNVVARQRQLEAAAKAAAFDERRGRAPEMPAAA